MFRLIMALGIAAVLLPVEVIQDDRQEPSIKVSNLDTLSAAQSLYQDVMTFCDRNEQACITGKALAMKTLHSVRSGINRQLDTNVPTDVDPVKTGSVFSLQTDK